MADWNWFFSSLSQSAAAIVGVFGAFIITKILSNQAVFSAKSSRQKELLTAAEKIRDDADSLCFDWYNRHTDGENFGNIENLIKGGADEDAEKIYDALSFSPFSVRSEVIQDIDVRLQDRRRRIEREQNEARLKAESRAQSRGLGNIFTAEMLPLNIPMPPNVVLDRNLQQERESIDRVIRDAKHQIRSIKDFLDTTRGDPESSPLISRALIMVTLLFYVGVIYPLSFMPSALKPEIELSWAAFSGLWFSLKGLLLFSVSAVFTTALAMFLRMNNSLRYSPKILDELESLTELKAYSDYFAIMEANLSHHEGEPKS